jgi:exosortase
MRSEAGRQEVTAATLRLAASCVVVAMLAYLYYDGLSILIRQWVRLGEQWRLLIPVVSIFFAWTKRKEILAIAAQPNRFVGGIVFFAGCLAYAVWKITIIDFIIEIGLVILTLGVCLLLLGTRHTRILLFPVSYLILATSLVGRVMDFLSTYLQHISAFLSEHFLNLAGWTVIRNGRFLRLPHMVLEIAAACSGTSQLTALVAFAAPVAFLRHRSWPLRCILIGLTLPIAIFFNSIRIVLIAIWNFNSPQAYLHGPNDILLIPIIYPFALLMLYLCSLFLDRFEIATKQPSKMAENKNPKKSAASNAAIMPWIIAIATLAVTFVSVSVFATRAGSLSRPDFPYKIDDWVGKDLGTSDVSFYLGSPDLIINRTFLNGEGTKVNLFIAYFANQNTGKRVMSAESKLIGRSTEPFVIHSDSLPAVMVNESIIGAANVNSASVYWYFFNGTAYNSIPAMRRAMALSTFQKRGNSCTFALISTRFIQDDFEDKAHLNIILSRFAGKVFPFICRFSRA